MLMIIDKCKKCTKDCKCFSETRAEILSCPEYVSKRAVSAQGTKSKPDVHPTEKRGLYESDHLKTA